MPPSTSTPQVTKRKVTMRSVVIDPSWNPDEHDGAVKTLTLEATDYVRPDFLDAYLVDARSRWQQVVVSDEPDAGPAGYDGATYVPPGLSHPLAGSYYPASDCGPDCTHAPDGAHVVLTPQEG